MLHAVDSGGEPLTKAKLFTTMREDGSWTEMGVGLVAITLKEADEGVDSARADGRANGVGNTAELPAGTRMAAHLEMVAFDDPAELLLSTPVSLEDVYAVQHDTILVWSDAELGCEMACSFNSKEGCDKIFTQLTEYQRERRRAQATASHGVPGATASSPLPSLNVISRWHVCRENLPAIVLGVTSNQKRFGLYVVDRDGFFKELVALFEACRADSDTHGMEQIGKVTLTLLSPPYNTEGRIIAQFVDNDAIDACVDIVQYALGRRTPETGFISFEQRRAMFRNPCELPPAMLTKIHVLHSCLFLKDLIPLSLDEGEAVSPSLLSTFLMRFKLGIIGDICHSDAILPAAYRRCQHDAGDAFALVGFLHDVSRSVKTAMVGLDIKEEIIQLLVDGGLFTFVQGALQMALDRLTPGSLGDAVGDAAASEPADRAGSTGVSTGTQEPERGLQRVTAEEATRAAQMCCDIVAHSVALHPANREALLALLVGTAQPAGSATEATSGPASSTLTSPPPPELPPPPVVSSNAGESVLTLLMRCLWTLRSRVALQGALEAVSSCCATLPPNVAPLFSGRGAEKRYDILRFWIEGVPPTPGPPPATRLATMIAEQWRAAALGCAPVSGDLAAVAAGHRPGFTEEAEVRVLYALKALSLLAREDPTNGAAFAQVLLVSRVVPALSGLLSGTPHGSRNLRSSVVLLLSTLVECGKTEVTHVLRGEGGPMDCAMSLFLTMHRRNNMMCSSLLHLFTELCAVLHRQKSRSLPGGSLTRSPFVRFLHAADDDSDGGLSTAEPGAGEGVIDSSLVAYLHEKYGERLAQASPQLLERFQRALVETPEEAHQADAESSSVASTIERAYSGRGDIDFEQLLQEFSTDVVPPPKARPDIGLADLVSAVAVREQLMHTPSQDRSLTSDDEATGGEPCDADSEDESPPEDAASDSVAPGQPDPPGPSDDEAQPCGALSEPVAIVPREPPASAEADEDEPQLKRHRTDSSQDTPDPNDANEAQSAGEP